MSLNLATLNHYAAVQSPLNIDPGGPVESPNSVFHLPDTVAQSLQNSVETPGSTVSLNPQPLPPRQMLQSSALTPGALVSINPQPLPPEPPENLWDVSAVLYPANSDTLQWYGGPGPEANPINYINQAHFS